MRIRIGFVTLLAILVATPPLAAQRPTFGLGIGGGVILGSQLVDHGFTATIDGQAQRLVQQVDLNEIAVASGHAEWYVTSRFALRAHGAWGGGNLEIVTRGESDSDDGLANEIETATGDVAIRAYDVGLSFWPWTPSSVGFAPFVTVGVGTFSYDFDTTDDVEYFQATGERSERAFLVGIGADLSVWRSLTLRIEAVNHLVDSPLRSEDFAAVADPREAFGDDVSNVRLIIGGHIYLPFSASSVSQ